MKTFLLLLTVSLLGYANANVTVCVGVPDETFVADPTACPNWYLCREEVGHPGTCPDNLYFDPVNRWCTYPEYAQCGLTSSPCHEIPDSNFVDNPATCGSWYYCSGGDAFPGVCDNDLYFDPINGVCTYPEWVDCESPPTVDPAVQPPLMVLAKRNFAKISPVKPREVLEKF